MWFLGMGGVVLLQAPCTRTPGGFSVFPNVLPDPIRTLLGAFLT